MTQPYSSKIERSIVLFAQFVVAAIIVALVVALCALIFSASAHAQAPGGGPSPGVFATVVLPALLRIALDPIVWSVVAGLAYHAFVQGKAARETKVKGAITAAYNIVEDLKATNQMPDGMTKPAIALEHLHSILGNQDVTLRDQEIDLAKSMWSAMHGESKGLLSNVSMVAEPLS